MRSVWSVVLFGAALLPSGTPHIAVADDSREMRRTAIVQAIEATRESVVNIHGQKLVVGTDDDASADLRRVNGMGTGVIIDGRGYVVTNYHVVEGVRRIEVTLASGKTVAGRLVSHDPRTDLAVLKIDVEEPLQVIRVGTSSDLMIGETVLALGNAFGYEHTVTRGIISALHRNVEVSRTQRYDDLIQTDASINPGNSGGPLLNIAGEMIGVNVAVRAGAQGIGFAIPIDRALAVVTELMSVERVAKTWHGIVARRHDGDAGVVVEVVHSESPAACCGVRELPLAAARPQKLSLEERAWQQLGLRVLTVPAVKVQKLQARYRGGLLVSEVRSDGPAAAQGIREGDILVGLHVWETIAPDNISYVLDKVDEENLGPIKFYVLRGRDTLFGHITSDTILR
jgi:serine protease Do